LGSCIALLACGKNPSDSSTDNSYNWQTATPESQGLNSNILSIASGAALNTNYVRSLLVVRNGYLIFEKYYNGFDKNDAHHVHSVSKSFMSAIVGVAYKENYLQNLDQKILDFFPEYITEDLDPRKHDITIKHLLTMTPGFSWEESSSAWTGYSYSRNWIEYAINLTLIHNPGEKWLYCTPGTNLLSGIVTKATGMTTKEFAEEYLFEPLGISINHWHQDPQGYYTGGHEMYFTSRDMARFGYLYLNNGLVEGQQIIPAEWVEESLRNYAGDEFDPGFGYGYSWWLGRMRNYSIYSASGLGGQFIFVIPELNMIVVTTASGSIHGDTSEQSPFIWITIVENYILSSILD